jgi:GDPmannose 4,6-dehydratase
MQASNLITGITGQDGSLIAKRLLEQGQRVTGLFRRSSADNFWRLKEMGILDKLTLLEADIESFGELGNILENGKFDKIFHLAGSSFTAESFRKPWQTFSLNTFAVFHILEAVRLKSPHTHLTIAGSSEVFGELESSDVDLIRDSSSRFGPINPYGLSHLSNLQIMNYYRELYSLRIACPIMFNHESEYRGEQFLTKKLSSGIVRIMEDSGYSIVLGNLNAMKDWGSAKEFIEFLYLASENSFDGSFVLGTGHLTSVREIVSRVFEYVGIEIESIGDGLEEKILNRENGRVLVSLDSRNLRVKETPPFKADRIECENIFGDAPSKSVLDVIPDMVEFDLRKGR